MSSNETPLGYRRARSEYCVTVELGPHQLPPKPNPVERFVDALERAAMWAPDLGDDLLDKVRDLIESARKKSAAKAATEEAA